MLKGLIHTRCFKPRTAMKGKKLLKISARGALGTIHSREEMLIVEDMNSQKNMNNKIGFLQSKKIVLFRTFSLEYFLQILDTNANSSCFSQILHTEKLRYRKIKHMPQLIYCFSRKCRSWSSRDLSSNADIRETLFYVLKVHYH